MPWLDCSGRAPACALVCEPGELSAFYIDGSHDERRLVSVERRKIHVFRKRLEKRFGLIEISEVPAWREPIKMRNLEQRNVGSHRRRHEGRRFDHEIVP